MDNKKRAEREIEKQLKSRNLKFNSNFMGGKASEETEESLDYQLEIALEIGAEEVLEDYSDIGTLPKKVGQWIADQIKYAPNYLTAETTAASPSGCSHQETKRVP